MKVTLELKDKYPVTPNRIREIVIREILALNRDPTENHLTIHEGVKIIGGSVRCSYLRVCIKRRDREMSFEDEPVPSERLELWIKMQHMEDLIFPSQLKKIIKHMEHLEATLARVKTLPEKWRTIDSNTFPSDDLEKALGACPFRIKDEVKS